MTKKTSTPTKPPRTAWMPAWKATTGSTATARRPSISGRYAAWRLCVRGPGPCPRGDDFSIEFLGHQTRKTPGSPRPKHIITTIAASRQSEATLPSFEKDHRSSHAPAPRHYVRRFGAFFLRYTAAGPSCPQRKCPVSVAFKGSKEHEVLECFTLNERIAPFAGRLRRSARCRRRSRAVGDRAGIRGRNRGTRFESVRGPARECGDRSLGPAAHRRHLDHLSAGLAASYLFGRSAPTRKSTPARSTTPSSPISITPNTWPMSGWTGS